MHNQSDCRQKGNPANFCTHGKDRINSSSGITQRKGVKINELVTDASSTVIKHLGMNSLTVTTKIPIYPHFLQNEIPCLKTPSILLMCGIKPRNYQKQ